MLSLRSLLVAALIVTLGGPTVFEAAAEAKAPRAAAKKGKPAAKKQQQVKRKSAKKKKKVKYKLVCKGKGAKRRCKRVAVARGPVISGHNVAASSLRTAPLPRPSGRVRISNPQVKREADVNIYNPDGSYNQEALAALDEVWMCRRTREVRAVDPRLYEVLSTISDHFGGKPVVLVSGFRFQRNEGSRHFHASAMDIRIPGVKMQDLYEYAETLDPGGMGIGRYPHLDFVHIDFRAPGAQSYRWTDNSLQTNPASPGKQPSRSWRRKKPNS